MHTRTCACRRGRPSKPPRSSLKSQSPRRSDGPISKLERQAHATRRKQNEATPQLRLASSLTPSKKLKQNYPAASTRRYCLKKTKKRRAQSNATRHSGIAMARAKKRLKPTPSSVKPAHCPSPETFTVDSDLCTCSTFARKTSPCQRVIINQFRLLFLIKFPERRNPSPSNLKFVNK